MVDDSKSSGINTHFTKKRKTAHSVTDYLDAIKSGDRVLLSQAITLIESKHPNHQQKAQEIIEHCLPLSGNSFRLGITGTPGVGKSTFIDVMGKKLVDKGQRVAVLAVDPSSQISKGSILGDKTRMQQLSNIQEVFIRPSAAGDSLGGVARKTREAIILCEAAGFDFIIIETVGVGQSETAVHSMTDFFLLLLLPNAGDELQGIKRGVMEMADLIAINKADGNAVEAAKLAQKQCRNGLHLFPPKQNAWTAKAMRCSALQDEGIDEILKEIQLFEKQSKDHSFFEKNRSHQAAYWFDESIHSTLRSRFESDPKIRSYFDGLKIQVIDGKISPFKAADQLIHKLLN